jgi:Fe2+ or Zn2+ uptake regulation protein
VTKKDKDKTVTRRGKIIELVQQNKWTLGKLAEHLHKTNSEWLVEKNKPAIYGTLASLKKKGWVVSRNDKGVISVTAK